MFVEYGNFIVPLVDVQVRNVRGTSRRGTICACGTWLDHWYVHTGSRRTRCAILGCGAPCRVGAHVVTDLPDFGRTEFIVPACHDCNHYSRVEWVDVHVNVPLVFVGGTSC